jgi:hypothetical protein
MIIPIPKSSLTQAAKTPSRYKENYQIYTNNNNDKDKTLDKK